ncbi:putative leucine-rich repeat receptor-like protein kinase [Canna indica]|uniref:non-specific serine/threonine protein kinase n=1 Tax=Canna indica TaxID=4628 RepID=A0AAQ3JVQ4_9LILI|nr:putative leucine-rich repeat receptor-like protein kinase [Canna indica]
MKRHLLLLFMCFACFQHGFSSTNTRDVSALKSLSKQWKNTPKSWGRGDPCDDRWEGINCSDSSVTELKLFNMDIRGQLSTDIGDLAELVLLDLSYNHNLGGPLPASIGNLKQLRTLRCISCNFIGPIPVEVGNLLSLRILALNSNKFTGGIPASLGRLINIQWLDLADNQLNGTLPTSANGSPGLDQLVNNEHFHLNQNNLSGPIPSIFFHSSMNAIHILLDHNNLSGEIPQSIGLVKKLKVLRLDNNSLNGSVPSNINNLTAINVLNLANNKLTGPMPNLTGMNNLNYLDLSNNSFDPLDAPAWLLDLKQLTTLIIESGNLHGEVPQAFFSFPRLEEVRLNNNAFNGTLNMGSNISQELQMVNFQNNDFTSVTLSSNYNKIIMLEGNPVCTNDQLGKTDYCGQQKAPASDSFSSTCSHPYEGPIICRAPSFSNIDIKAKTDSMWTKIKSKLSEFPITSNLGNSFFDGNNYLQVQLQICHNKSKYFTRNETLVWLDLSTQNLNLSEQYGPCFFNPNQYSYDHKGHRGLIIGVVVGSAAAMFIIAGLGTYAVRQRKRAKKAINLNNPFASWGSAGDQDGSAPQIKLAKYFSLDEIRKFTNGFSKDNEIGAGGYGKVYKGILSDGQIVAIKISQKGSMQGGLEFKTEIEMLSRVHHKNLVELVGFCFEKGERTLVYEYISNGTLTDNLSGKKGMHLNWKRRLNIALDSARGLAYLHELAKPPIIHRDVKSSNILLDDDLIAKVADFGLSILVVETERDHVSTGVKGTLGYLDPEYFMTQQLTAKSDVYSLGVVMLELITATLPIVNGKYIVREIKMAIDDYDAEFYGLKDMIDPALMLNTGCLVGFKRFAELALQCVQESSENRPTMNDIVREIEIILKDIELKSISTSSSATYFGNARVAFQEPYDELALSSGVNSATVNRSDEYLLS